MKKVFALAFAILLVLPFIYFGLKVSTRIQSVKSGSGSKAREVGNAIAERYQASIEGEVVCLPFKGKKEPNTLECTPGLKTKDGLYYATDTNLMSQTLPDYGLGDRIKANGLITPIEMLSSDHWQKYEVEGIFSITDSLEVMRK